MSEGAWRDRASGREADYFNGLQAFRVASDERRFRNRGSLMVVVLWMEGSWWIDTSRALNCDEARCLRLGVVINTLYVRGVKYHRGTKYGTITINTLHLKK